jgi:hypothetical protein
MPYNVEALKELSERAKKASNNDAKARMKARLAEKAKKSKKQESSSESEEEERKEYKQPKLTKKNAMKARSDFKTIDGQKHVETDMVIRKGLTPSEKHALQQSIFHAVEHHLAGSGLVIDVDGMYNNHPYTDHIHSSKIYFTSDSESDNERPTVKTIAKRRGRPPNIQEPISRITGGDLGYDIGSFVTHNILGMQKSKGKGTGRGRGRPRKIVC